MALVGISAITSLILGLVLYYFAGSRLIEVEGSLLIQRSRTANAGAEEFLSGLRDPGDRTLPPAGTYAEELASSVSDFTGLGILYTTPGGEPLAARDPDGDAVPPEEAYERLGLDQRIIERALEDSNGQLVPREGRSRYVAVWPLTGANGDVQGAMVYNAPQEALNQTLGYLRYGIIGSMGASILLAGIASLLLAREITRPLSKTRDAAIRVASGDYAPVVIEREDELGEVARAFNYMVAEVEHYIGEIQEQKSRLEGVLEASPEAVIALDPQDRVTMANPAAGRMLGIQTSDYGRKIEDTSVPREIVHCVRESSLTGVAVREVELGDNSYWTYAAQMNREEAGQNGENGGNAGVILAVRDISEHRSLERAKTNFVSDVSHELRTPLTTIQSAVDLVERARDRMEPMEHRALELANQELKRIRSMVEELLVLAQVDSWQYSLEVSPTDLSSVIRNSVESMQLKAERFGIEVNFDEAGEHQCVCDSQKLYQVFLNLIDNAVKYSDPGARVDISVEEDESSLAVRISDTGFGIPEEDRGQLFDRFYRVNKDRSRSTGGSGLGLAISREIVSLHGGEIEIESAVGRGSTFTVRIPKTPLPRSANYAI